MSGTGSSGVPSLHATGCLMSSPKSERLQCSLFALEKGKTMLRKSLWLPHKSQVPLDVYLFSVSQVKEGEHQLQHAETSLRICIVTKYKIENAILMFQ